LVADHLKLIIQSMGRELMGFVDEYMSAEEKIIDWMLGK